MMKMITNTSAMGPGCHHFHYFNVEKENIILEVKLTTIRCKLQILIMGKGEISNYDLGLQSII